MNKHLKHHEECFVCGKCQLPFINSEDLDSHVWAVHLQPLIAMDHQQGHISEGQ